MEIKIISLPVPMIKNILDSSKIVTGLLTISEDRIIIKIKGSEIIMKFSDIKSIELENHYKIATYIHIISKKNEFNFCVPRFTLFDWFVTNNYFKTKETYNLLKNKMETVSADKTPKK
jgi:hypothetical protein